MPPQIVEPNGQVYYWSISTGLTKNASAPGGTSSTPLYTAVQYEEIINGEQSNKTAFDYVFQGDAKSSLDMSDPGYTGNVTGKTILVETPFALAYQMLFWPNITAL